MCRTHWSGDIRDHFPAGLVALAVVGSLLLLLQHAVPGGAVLQGELAEDFAEPVDADLPHAVGRVPEEQQERVEPEGKQSACSSFLLFSGRNRSPCVAVDAPPVDDPAVHNLQDDDPLGAVLEEVRHLLLELWLHLVLGDHLQVVPRRLAAPLHLTQVLL